ncbi:MAG: BA14K family protein [Rhizobiaceae bacterium]
MKPRLGTLARAGLLAIGMSGAAYAGPAGVAPLAETPQPLAVTPVQWICDGSAGGSPSACRNNETGEVRDNRDIRNGRVNQPPRYDYENGRRVRNDDWRWRNWERDRRDDGRYRVNRTRAHVAWCQDRWRSYRAYDNTYQPARGPRRQCVSPYG